MRFIGIASYGFLLASSAVLAGAFAFDVGSSHGLFFGYVFAGAIGALLILESVLAGRRVWLGVIPVALAIATMEIGFSASLFADHAATRLEGARAAKIAAQVEPAPVLRARLEAFEAGNKGLSKLWCASKNENLRSACAVWSDLKVQLAQAEVVERSPAATGEADPRAELLARRLGGSVEQWADWLVILIALALTWGRVSAASVLFREAKESVQPMQKREPETAVENSVAPEVSAQPRAQKPKLPRDAEKVLRVVKSEGGSQAFLGFLPPLSQRTLAEKAKLPRKATVEALKTLEAAGVVRVAASREGTRIEVLT